MVEVFVGIGSNIEPARHVAEALAALGERFGRLRCSPVYRSKAVGFKGDDFYNLVAAFTTDRNIFAVHDILADIETATGRDRSGPRFAPRRIDLDLLLYGDAVRDPPGPVVPRPEILRYAFVLKPLADLAGERRHPIDGRRFAKLWDAFDAADQPLHPVAPATADHATVNTHRAY
jgi:2-amino-4-hydroxy-6-hydroxymethyldihydropteridine diphosphokinase